MSNASRRYRVGLLGMFTSRNLGDAAIVREVLRNIAERRPDCEFVAINREPEDGARLLGIAAFPSDGYGRAFRPDGSDWIEVDHPSPKWLAGGLGTRRILAVVRTLDLLVMAGGGQIEDFFGGLASQPRILFTWTGLARMLGVPVAYFGVGVDQLLGAASRMLVVNALRLATMRSFRDAGSVELLRQAGLRASSRVDPDPALGIDARAMVRGPAISTGRIVVSPVSFRTFASARNEPYERYLQCLALACDQWSNEGRALSFVCSHTTMDPPVVDEVLARTSAGTRSRCVVARSTTVEDLLDHVRGANCVVASRLHGVVLAVVAGAPVIAVSPARKVTRFMRDCGFADFCVEMPQMAPDMLPTLVRRIADNRLELHRKVAEIAQTSRARLDQAYDELAALLPPRQALSA